MHGNCSLFFLLLTIIHLSFSCPFNPNSLPQPLNCIQNIACESDQSGNQLVFMQNCNTRWYFGTSSAMTELKSTSHNQTNYFIKNSKKATSIKSNFYYSLINFSYSSLFCYIYRSQIYNFQLPVDPGFIDFQLSFQSNNTYKILVLYQNKIVTLVFYSNTTIASIQKCITLYDLSKIQCFENGVCAVGTMKGDILLFDSTTDQIESLQLLNENSAVILLQAKTINNQTGFYKLYIAYASGKIIEYFFQNNFFHRQRTCRLFIGTIIFQISSYPNSNYLIITDTLGNVSQIDLTTGILLDSVNLQPYLANKSNVSIQILLDSTYTYYAFNSLNSALFYVDVTPNDTKNTVTLYCIALFYYNNNSQICTPCDELCVTCDPLSGACTDCFNGYFNKRGTCQSCYYNSQGLTQYFGQCFSYYDHQLMETSQKVVKFLSVIISNFALFLNVCGLLFLFLKLINNWNIICFYFFMPIKLPFFLENVLLTMFKSFNQSVLQNIGIDFNPSFNEIEETTNEKFNLVGISNDFLALNAESIILFLYSVVLIMTVYKFVNYLCSKIYFLPFEQNSSISIIDEFIGNFTTSLLSFHFIIFNNSFQTYVSKINSTLHIFLIGIAMFVAILFLILNFQFKIVKTNKIYNQSQDAIARYINQGLIKITKTWKQNDSMDKFLYALLSFTTAMLAPFPNPFPFMVIVGLIHLLSIINVFRSKKISFNKFFQKLWFLCFHGCFNSLYFIQDQYLSFQVSLATVMLIIIIAVHQIVSSLCTKVFFIYKIIQLRQARAAQIDCFFQKDNHVSGKKKRMHPISIDKIPGVANAENMKTIKYKFKSFEIECTMKTERKIQNQKLKKKQKQYYPSKQIKSKPQFQKKSHKIIFQSKYKIQEQLYTNTQFKRPNKKQQ